MQVASLHLLLSNFQSKHKFLFLLLSCSPHLDRETPGNKVLVMVLSVQLLADMHYFLCHVLIL